MNICTLVPDQIPPLTPSALSSPIGAHVSGAPPPAQLSDMLRAAQVRGQIKWDL